jgi:hypothetical protein
MSKKLNKPSFTGSGQTNLAIGGVAGPQGHYEHVLFIDRGAGIKDADVKKLEDAGFHVVLTKGQPSQSIYQATIYRQ